METRYDKYEPFFGSWHIKSRIGRGATGEVYLIEREDLGNVYRSALKCITIPESNQELLAARTAGMTDEEVKVYYQTLMNQIKSELINMAHVKGNSNVVNYEDHMIVPHEDGIGWDIMIRMEYLTTLYHYCDEHELSTEDVLRMGIDLSRALEICKHSGIIHRDIKPDNIFVSENGDFKLGDFGVSRVVEETRVGLSLRGTYTYMAPEVYKGEAYGQRSDIYSLGLVLYKFLNGGRDAFLPAPGTAFVQDDVDRAFFQRMSGAPLPPPINGSEDFRNAVLKACAYRPDDRFRTARGMRVALEEIDYRLKHGGAEAAGAGEKRSKKVAAVALAAAAVIALVIFLAIPKKVTDVAGIDPVEEVLIGETVKVDYQIEPDRFEDEPIDFSSSDSEVLTVDESGALTGLSVGEATVVIKVREFTKSVDVKVLPKVTKITVADSSVKIYAGKPYHLKPKLKPVQYADEPISYKSSDKKVAAVSKEGVIKARRVGKATITIAAGGCEKKVKVTVRKKPVRKPKRKSVDSGGTAAAGTAQNAATGGSAAGYSSGGSSGQSYGTSAGYSYGQSQGGSPGTAGQSSSGSSQKQSGGNKGSFSTKDYEYFQ